MHILFITPPKKKQEFVDPQKTIGVRTDLYFMNRLLGLHELQTAHKSNRSRVNQSLK